MLFVLVPVILTQYRVTERWRWKPKPIRVCSDMFSVNVWQWWKRSLTKGQLKQNKHLQTNDAPWKWRSLEWRPKESCLGCLSGAGCQTFGFEIIPICLLTPLETNFKQDWLASSFEHQECTLCKANAMHMQCYFVHGGKCDEVHSPLTRSSTFAGFRAQRIRDKLEEAQLINSKTVQRLHQN